MTNVAQDPVVSANVIFDILNEPDSRGLTWGGSQLNGQGLGYWCAIVQSAALRLQGCMLSYCKSQQ